MAQSVGAIALDIVMGENTVAGVVRESMTECQNVVSSASTGISGKINAIGTATTKVGAAMLPMSSGIIAMGTACVSTADDIDSAVNTYITSTGSATKEAGKFEDVMKNIYKNNYGESFEDIAQSMATVKKGIDGITDDNIQKVTESAITMRDTFGIDVNESVRAVNTIMQNFGVTSDEAFNLIAQGAQNGLDFSDEMIDSINEYSVQFQKLGFDAEDMFSIFVSGAENGAFNLDKIGDAVKELSIRAIDCSGTTVKGFTDIGLNADEMAQKFAKGGDSASEAFDEVITGLAGIKDPVKQNAAGVALFGTMWEDLGADVVTSLSTANKSISQTTNTMEEMKKIKYDDLKNQLAGIGRTVTTDIIVPLGERLLPVIESVVGKVAEWVSAFGELSPVMQDIVIAVGGVVAGVGPLLIVIGKVASGVGSIISVGTTVVGFITGTVVPALSSFFAFIMANPIVLVITAIVAAIVLLIANWETVKEVALNVWNAICDTVTTIGNAIKDFLITAWDTIKTTITNVLDNIKTTMSNVWNAIKTTISTVVNAIKTTISNVWNAIKTTISTVVNAIKTTVSNVFNAIKTTISTIFNAVKTTVSNVWNSIKDVISNVIDAIKTTVSNKFNAVKNTISNIVDNVKTTMSNGFNAAKDTVTNIFNSIKNKISNIMDGAKNIVSGAIDKIKGFFNFEWSLPKIKLPHFKISGSFSLNPPSVPSFGIDWYAKAMDKGMILNSPTIFGMNSNGQPMGAGEAGSETIVGTNSLMSMIQSAVSSSMGTVRIEAPALNNVKAGSRQANDNNKIDELIALVKKLLDNKYDGNMTVPIYIGNELIDEYILNKNNRQTIRSGGYA